MSNRTSHTSQAWSSLAVVAAMGTIVLFGGFNRGELYGAVRATSARAATPADARVAVNDEEPAASAVRAQRAWGPEQATGKPDTFEAGDIQTAWASQTRDGQSEWLLLEYAEAIEAKAIVIHETYNPGAVTKVTVFDPDGKEVVAWSGADPTPRTDGKGISVIPIKVKFKISRVKISIDSPGVPGWNEIDAVGIRGSTAKIHWAVAARASSTYARQVVERPAAMLAARKQRINYLEADVKRLKQEVKRLRKLEAELAELKKLLKSCRNP